MKRGVALERPDIGRKEAETDRAAAVTVVDAVHGMRIVPPPADTSRRRESIRTSEGQTVVIEVRYAMGRPDRFSSLAHELVGIGRRETTALLAATREVPVVFMQVNDPVEQGFVASLAQPGGNTTGFTQMSAELDPKRFQLCMTSRSAEAYPRSRGDSQLSDGEGNMPYIQISDDVRSPAGAGA
jgi:hypothetical protein